MNIQINPQQKHEADSIADTLLSGIATRISSTTHNLEEVQDEKFLYNFRKEIIKELIKGLTELI